MSRDVNRVLDVPCGCALYSLLHPEWEGMACACHGPNTYMAPDGGQAVLALIRRPGIDQGPQPAELTLAELVLHGRERLSLPEWLGAIKREAENVLSGKS